MIWRERIVSKDLTKGERIVCKDHKRCENKTHTRIWGYMRHLFVYPCAAQVSQWAFDFLLQNVNVYSHLEVSRRACHNVYPVDMSICNVKRSLAWVIEVRQTVEGWFRPYRWAIGYIHCPGSQQVQLLGWLSV